MCGPDGRPTKALAEMTPDELRVFTTERAEQIRSARLKQHDMGDETWDVGVVQVGNDPATRSVVITTNLPLASAPGSLRLAPGEVFRTPALGTPGARPSKLTPAPHDPIGNATHAEPRMEAVVQSGEVLLAHSPTRGLCVLCQQTVHVDLVPLTHRTPEAYTAWRAPQVAAGMLPSPPPRLARLYQRATSDSHQQHIDAIRHETRYDRMYGKYYDE